ncbi:MAG TPA: DUF5009 domain-containing protein [Draconibacterium sp.]|nr:DUF5009 domain-containing protein [Draconibacterium sp.]
MTTKPLRTAPDQRLQSLDVLRGFDMFWITGGGYLFTVIAKATGATWLENTLEHAEWAGFHFEDLIFPLFMFIAGIAIPFSAGSKLDKNVPRKKLLGKAFKRMLILIILGMLYNGVFQKGLDGGRFPSVLGQIGVGYFFASLVYLYFPDIKNRIFWVSGILVGYGIIQLLIPVPGIGAGVLTPDGCINGYIDKMLLSGHIYRANFDPEGILCSLSATGVTLLGTFAGTILKQKQKSDWQKIGMMAAIGAGLVVLALLLSTFYPIIKKCWTSTFNILTGGIGFMLMALFFLIVDHWKIRGLLNYFRIIGMNSIFVYLFVRIIDVQHLTEFFVGWLAKPMGEVVGGFFLIISGLAIIWLILYYMYKKNIFLRV